ncbi:PREDICTED: uncharacterized protein LOC109181081 isoform X2 [Ipomoea nil]|uniref:uncharacterized protein LOC109181081 isoform X2 n=1 Tax=Ipomoea nil TaxID=35883 RepID=UPI000900E5A0|nr:PREDICTED: uncharacterized protein LOC109181081 isoform X2 [Ipomoea nil]
MICLVVGLIAHQDFKISFEFSVRPPPPAVHNVESSIPSPPDNFEFSVPSPPDNFEFSAPPPTSAVHNVESSVPSPPDVDLSFLEDVDMSFLEDAKFEPYYYNRSIDKFRQENGKFDKLRSEKLKLCLIFSDLLIDKPHQYVMINFASALKKIGHEIQVFTLEDGPMRSVWGEDYGIPVRIIPRSNNLNWLKFDVVFLNSFDVMFRNLLSTMAITFKLRHEESFKSVPVIWTVRERALAIRLEAYSSTTNVDDWRKLFKRVNAVVFPNYNLPIAYSKFDTGNYFVIPELLTELQKDEEDFEDEEDGVDVLTRDLAREMTWDIYRKIGCRPAHTMITIVGSQQYQYKDLLRDQALVLQALLPVYKANTEVGCPKFIKIVVFGGPSMIETVALKLKYPIGAVKHMGPDEDADTILRLSDFVIYASFHEEEQAFPYTLLKAMRYQIAVVIAPDLPIIKKHVVDGVSAFLFPKNNVKVLTKMMIFYMEENEENEDRVQNVTVEGSFIAEDHMMSKSIEGYGLLLENLLLENIIKIPTVAAKSPPFPTPRPYHGFSFV